MFHKKVPWLGTLVNIAGMEWSFRVYSLDMFEGNVFRNNYKEKYTVYMSGLSQFAIA